MRNLGEAPRALWSNDTCVHRGRVINVFQREGKLCVCEAVLGGRPTFPDVQTNLEVGGCLACCSLGEEILILVGAWVAPGNRRLAILLRLDDGALSPARIHTTTLAVSGGAGWPDGPYLGRLTDSRAMFYFPGRNELWTCDVQGSHLEVRSAGRTPLPGGFCCQPAVTSDGRLLVAGGRPVTRAVCALAVDSSLTAEDLGELPGEARSRSSTVLVQGRFVVGFGGAVTGNKRLDDLWVFDLQTRAGSAVRKDGTWHKPDRDVPLAVQGGALFIVGGVEDSGVYALPLPTLATLIENPRIRQAFHEAVRSLRIASWSPPTRPALSMRKSLANQPPTPQPTVPQTASQVAPLQAELERIWRELEAANRARENVTRELRRAEEELRQERAAREQDRRAAERQAAEQAAVISALQAEREELQTRLRAAPPPGALAIPMPRPALPMPPAPGRLRLSRERLHRTLAANRAHHDDLLQQAFFLREYRRAFGPLLEEGIPRLTLLCSESLRQRSAAVALARQGSFSVRPGQFPPPNFVHAALAGCRSSGVGDKLADSEVAQCVGSPAALLPAAREQAPPVYRSLLTFLDVRDPLGPEALHETRVRIRRVLQVARAAEQGLQGADLANTIRSLQRLLRAGERGYDV